MDNAGFQLPYRSFLFLRHGETDWNQQNRLQGRADIPLNAQGTAQAVKAADLLQSAGLAAICSSPLQRAQKTAKLIADAAVCPLHIIDELTECDWGPLEGAVPGAFYADWLAGRPIHNGVVEPFTDFCARIMRGLAKAMDRPGPVLVVGHGGGFWAIRQFAEVLFPGPPPNAEPLLIEPPDHNALADDRWRVRLFSSCG